MEEMDEAMEQGYDAWAEAIKDSPGSERLLDVINKDNFDTFVEMHKARQDGDYETAKELAEELGIGGFGKMGQRKGRFEAGMHQRQHK